MTCIDRFCLISFMIRDVGIGVGKNEMSTLLYSKDWVIITTKGLHILGEFKNVGVDEV